MITFKKTDEIEELDAEALLAEELTARQKKYVPINNSIVKDGSITFKKSKGGGSGSSYNIVSAIIRQYTQRVLADGGIIETGCLQQQLYKYIR